MAKFILQENQKQSDLAKMSRAMSDEEFSLSNPNNNNYPEDMESFRKKVHQVCAEYLQKCININTLPTFAGLANRLGLTRTELKTYSDDPIVANILQKYKQQIEAYAEEKLLEGKPAQGLAFWLKNNAGWVDQYDYNTSEKSIGQILDELTNQPNSQIIKGQLVNIPKQESPIPKDDDNKSPSSYGE